MPLNPDAAIEITAFRWVPEFAQGVVRDLRARWALEEAGLDYKVRLLDQQRPPEYLKEQPFDQVPILREGDLQIFESGRSSNMSASAAKRCCRATIRAGSERSNGRTPP